MNNDGNLDDVTTNGATSVKYKSRLLGASTVEGANRKLKYVKIVVPLKYLSNFFRSLEMTFINYKIHLELNWTNTCVMSYLRKYLRIKFTAKRAKIYCQKQSRNNFKNEHQNVYSK